MTRKQETGGQKTGSSTLSPDKTTESKRQKGKQQNQQPDYFVFDAHTLANTNTMNNLNNNISIGATYLRKKRKIIINKN